MTRADPPIALFSPAAENAAHAAELDAAWQRVSRSGAYILGDDVAAFEQEVARYCGAQHAVATASGTDALHLALRAAGVGTGDEVITTAFSFAATAAGIIHAGARPVFADIDPITLNLDPTAVEHALSSQTRAIVAVDLFGLPANWQALSQLATRRGLILVDD